MTEQDAILERLIDRAYMRLQHGKTREIRCQALEEMEALIAKRSPARIAEMERERGLR